MNFIRSSVGDVNSVLFSGHDQVKLWTIDCQLAIIVGVFHFKLMINRGGRIGKEGFQRPEG